MLWNGEEDRIVYERVQRLVAECSAAINALTMIPDHFLGAGQWNFELKRVMNSSHAILIGLPLNAAALYHLTA
jgi:hypothetical protein